MYWNWKNWKIFILEKHILSFFIETQRFSSCISTKTTLAKVYKKYYKIQKTVTNYIKNQTYSFLQIESQHLFNKHKYLYIIPFYPNRDNLDMSWSTTQTHIIPVNLIIESYLYELGAIPIFLSAVTLSINIACERCMPHLCFFNSKKTSSHCQYCKLI